MTSPGAIPPTGYRSSPLRPGAALLAVLVSFVWGTNFVVMHLGLEQSPPLAFAALRFVFAALPAVFFFRRPCVPWWTIIAYGTLIGVGQFGLLFMALAAGVAPGLASLVIQLQVFFTLILSAVIFRERILLAQWCGAALGLAGLCLIGLCSHEKAALGGLTLIVLAALAWAGANLVLKSIGSVNMIGFVTWSSVIAAPILVTLSLLIEGPERVMQSLVRSEWVLWAAVAWQAYANTLAGYAVWGWLLSRHSVGSVAPSALLVPIFGMSSSMILLGESMQWWKLLAALLVIAGLTISMLAPGRRPARARVLLTRHRAVPEVCAVGRDVHARHP